MQKINTSTVIIKFTVYVIAMIYFQTPAIAQENTQSDLPIGVFDSGTGGLTVLNKIITLDSFKNNEKINLLKKSDGKPDFSKESFIYLGDQANMPYGLYSSQDKVDLLREHIIKDAQFLMGKEYHRSGKSIYTEIDKRPVKAIVVACNTATAYGSNVLQNWLKETNQDIPIIGVIDAGARAALNAIDTTQAISIGVFATVGTVKSNGYIKAISSELKKESTQSKIKIYQQGGFGLAAAIDGNISYISPTATSPRKNYKGPSTTNSNAPINIAILDRYNFDPNGILSNKNNTTIQLNSIHNYIAYHVVSLLENMKNTNAKNPLKTIILGCTHYPYFYDIFSKELSRLRQHKENGKYIYRHLISKKISIIDPAVTTAEELYEILYKKNILDNKHELGETSEFYISVPNKKNPNIQLDKNGQFTFDYKYGRNIKSNQVYVHRIPFNKDVINSRTRIRLSEKVPHVYSLIKEFGEKNNKLKNLDPSKKI